jgi:hypothetical protein
MIFGNYYSSREACILPTLPALEELLHRLLALAHVLAERLHELVELVALLLHLFALGAVVDRVGIDRGFGFLQVGCERVVLLLQCLLHRN